MNPNWSTDYRAYVQQSFQLPKHPRLTFLCAFTLGISEGSKSEHTRRIKLHKNKKVLQIILGKSSTREASSFKVHTKALSSVTKFWCGIEMSNLFLPDNLAPFYAL